MTRANPTIETSLSDLLEELARMDARGDPAVALVTNSAALTKLRRDARNAEVFGSDGQLTTFKGLPLRLDHECPGAVLMNADRLNLWLASAGAQPFGRLSER